VLHAISLASTAVAILRARAITRLGWVRSQASIESSMRLVRTARSMTAACRVLDVAAELPGLHQLIYS
jgi:hypothetical protein